MRFLQVFQKKQAAQAENKDDAALRADTIARGDRGGGVFRVRRLSGMPMVFVYSVLIAVVAVIGFVAWDRTKQPAAGMIEKQENNTPALSQAREIADTVQGKRFTAPDIPKKNEEKPAEPEKNDAAAKQGNLQVPPTPRLSPDKERVFGEKMRNLEVALKSRTSIPLQFSQNGATGTGFERAPVQASDPMSAYQARLAQVNASLPEEPHGGSSSLLGSSSGQGKTVEQFNRQNRWTLENRVEAPASPYIVRAGFVVPAIMLSGISSDLPGQVMAQISQNIYDSATGRYLLIPQGTRLVGTYASDIAYGQSRVMMAWQRLIFPDGKTLDIGAMPGADQSGKAGFKDKVDNHYFRIFGSAILLSGVIAGVTLSQDNRSSRDSDRQRASDALSEALGQTLGNAMAQMFQKNLNIAPTLEIRPGYRFNIMVTKDLTLPGMYRAFDY